MKLFIGVVLVCFSVVSFADDPKKMESKYYNNVAKDNKCIDRQPESVDQLKRKEQLKLLQKVVKANPDCRFTAVIWDEQLGDVAMNYKMLVHDNGKRPHLTMMTYSKGKKLINQVSHNHETSEFAYLTIH